MKMYKTNAIPLAVLLVLGLVLRLAAWPDRGVAADCDEMGYLTCGVQMWEGVPASYKTGPNGPQTWAQWLYMASLTGKHFFLGDSQIRSAPWQSRAYLATDAALFDTYANQESIRQVMLALSAGISLLGIAAAYRLGRAYGGTPGGCLLGGAVALWPLAIEMGAQTRPYSDSWMFGIMALAATTKMSPNRIYWIGVYFGFAVASRLDMLGLLPLLVWLMWTQPTAAPFYKQLFGSAVVGAVVTLLLAPWILTNLLGNLRLWVTHIFIGQHVGARAETAYGIFWEQGFAAFIALGFVGLLLSPKTRSEWIRRGLLLAIVALQLWGIFGGPPQPMRFHGSRIIVLLVAMAIGIPGITNRFPKWSALVVGFVLAGPALFCAIQTVEINSHRYDGNIVPWIETHVPDGTTIYMSPGYEIQTPLPTEASSRQLWEEVYGFEAWSKKYTRGVSRFQLQSDGYLPRALAQENLVLDRFSACRFFILGSGRHPDRPRFNIKIYAQGEVFYTPLSKLKTDFDRTGGIVISRNQRLDPNEFGDPVYTRLGASGRSLFVYCSRDLRPALEGRR